MPTTDGIFIDEIVDKALYLTARLPSSCGEYVRHIEDLRERLAGGKLRLAVLGQFNRGKSTFINALLGLRVLPISVLPLTSVPTTIRHGSRNSCTIRFANGLPALHEEHSPEQIATVLSRYVTEEGNPRNRDGVEEAVVECPSELLRHGTVLIDTPGFGSTFVHNTKTSVDLLPECDAALFLLSADLPITQVELEFLRDVRKHVPRVFFIYNKVDLLSGDELTKTRDFIAHTLTSSLGILDIDLFPVCARTGQEAAYGTEQWERSGIGAVRTHVVEFMLREKYFALAHALTGKLGEALGGILTALHQRQQELEEPLVAQRQSRDTVAANLSALEQELDGASVFAEEQRRELAGHLRGFRERNRAALGSRAESVICELALRSETPERTIRAALPRILSEMLAQIRLEARSAVGAELGKAVEDHVSAFERQQERVTSELGLPHSSSERLREWGAESVQTEITDSWEPLDSTAAIGDLRISLLDRLRGRSRRTQALLQAFLPVATGNIEENLYQLSAHLISRTRTVLARVEELLSEESEDLLNSLRERLAQEETRLAQMERDSAQEREQVAELIRGYTEVRKLLGGQGRGRNNGVVE